LSNFQSGILRWRKDKEKERDAAEVELSKLNLPHIDEERHGICFTCQMYLAVLKSSFVCFQLYKYNGSLTAFHNFGSQTSLLALVSGILSEWF
jgi:hypothetical protein